MDLEGEGDEELNDDLKVLACRVSDGATLSKTWSLGHWAELRGKIIYF